MSPAAGCGTGSCRPRTAGWAAFALPRRAAGRGRATGWWAGLRTRAWRIQTGLSACRSGEILSLRWEHVNLDRGELRLPDSKTGAKIVHLGEPAIAVLRGIRCTGDSPWVFPGQKLGTHLAFLHGPWHRILEHASIKDLRIHDLRHSFASGGLLVGEGLPMIGKLLGHNKVQTTARYAHLANDPVKSAANRIATRIAKVAG